MNILNKLKTTLKTIFFENIYTRKVNIQNDKAIFSFTFDDVPISAAENGASILKGVNALGTYYVALGMEDIDEGNNINRRFFNETEIKSLINCDHDIGCHTYSHLNLRKTNVNLAKLDCDKNVQQLKEITGMNSINHFAYPFGMVSPQAKRELGKKYLTLRTTDSGLNVGVTDLTHLRAVNIYSDLFDKNKILNIINEAVKSRAWLIFYTHDICDKPSRWGTKPEDLEWVVEQCSNAYGEILSVDQAYKKIVNHI